MTSVFYASVLLFIINFVIRLSKYLWIHEAITNTSANETIFISPWKRHRENGLDAGISTSTRIKNFPFSCACAHAYALLQRVKAKYRSGITQAQGSLQHVVMFVQWKHWIQITSRLNSFIKHKCSDGLILVLCRISFSLGSSLLLVYLPALVLAWPVKKKHALVFIELRLYCTRLQSIRYLIMSRGPTRDRNRHLESTLPLKEKLILTTNKIWTNLCCG